MLMPARCAASPIWTERLRLSESRAILEAYTLDHSPESSAYAYVLVSVDVSSHGRAAAGEFVEVRSVAFQDLDRVADDKRVISSIVHTFQSAAEWSHGLAEVHPLANRIAHQSGQSFRQKSRLGERAGVVACPKDRVNSTGTTEMAVTILSVFIGVLLSSGFRSFRLHFVGCWSPKGAAT